MGKVPFIWTAEQQQAFGVMKAMMICDYLLPYPDYNNGFQIYTDASGYQLGAILMQDGAPVTYYSRKLTNLPTHQLTMKLYDDGKIITKYL